MSRESPRIGCVATVAGVCWSLAAILFTIAWMAPKDQTGQPPLDDDGVTARVFGTFCFWIGFFPALAAGLAYLIRDEPRDFERPRASDNDSS